ncbi:protein FAM162B isoform X2 [Lepisosteus oculatus]|uniref:protein FAM162B isoform X2 n=1 Tax=Lepisosteus oculatus TaxID=7918 RepID=UPI00370FDCB9
MLQLPNFPEVFCSVNYGHVRRAGPGAQSARRQLCSKPQQSHSEPTAQSALPNSGEAVQPGFKIPGYKLSDFDKKILLWAGRFKTKEQIPEIVSFEMIDGARNKVRVKACYAMIVLTVVGCLGMVILGKQAVGRHESLTSLNMEKKARWRQEAQRETEAAAVVVAGEKTQ